MNSGLNTVLTPERLVALRQLAIGLGVSELGVFGSAARGEATPESDLDLAYRWAREPQPDTLARFLDFAEACEHLFNRKVDLVNLDYLQNELLRKYILTDYQCVYAA